MNNKSKIGLRGRRKGTYSAQNLTKNQIWCKLTKDRWIILFKMFIYIYGGL